jgi:predicted lipoprotein with Yx(FWY)xxD motif
MRSSNLRFVAIAALAAIAFAACSSSSKTASTATNAPTSTTAAPATTTPAGPATTSPVTASAPTAATVSIANSKFGKILVDSKGMTLYVDENDKPGAPACTAACLQAWPPLVAPATPTYGAGVDAAKYSTVTLSDGTKQLAVGGFPLYTWTADKVPGDVTGQDVNHFYAVMANGVKYDPGSSSGS